MSSSAKVECVLKVNINCEACQGKIHEVLSSSTGVYSLAIDAEEGLAKITGEMEPNALLSALSRNSKHAEIKSIKIRSPIPTGFESNAHCRSKCFYGNYDHGRIPFCSGEQRALPQEMCHETYQSYHHPYRGTSYGYHGPPCTNSYPFRNCSTHRRN